MNLLKCFRFLNLKDYIKLTSDVNCLQQFKTFGLMIKENLNKHLIESNKKYYPFNVFPVNDLQNLNDFKIGLSHDNINDFAVYFTTFQPNSVNHLFQSWTQPNEIKNLVLICDPSQSLNAFYSLQSKRYRYWRSLSGFPSRFHQSKLETQTHEEELTIGYKTDWMDTESINIESIHYYKDKHVVDNLIGSNLSTHSHLIWCKINVDYAILAYLIDGCLIDGEEHDIKGMWFHEILAPYHVAFNIKMSEKVAVNSRLDEVANYLMKELKDSGINIFPFFHRFIDSSQLTFERFDKVGIPYTVSLNEDNLKKGIVGLRNRDTKLEESIHITRLKVYLFLYLKRWKPQDIVDLKNVNLNI